MYCWKIVLRKKLERYEKLSNWICFWLPFFKKEENLFRNKKFALDKMFQQNAAIFYVSENPHSFLFCFSFCVTFSLINALASCMKWNTKTENDVGYLMHKIYSKCWKHFFECKPFTSERWKPKPEPFPAIFWKKMFTFWLKSRIKSQIPRWAGQPACPLVYRYKSEEKWLQLFRNTKNISKKWQENHQKLGWAIQRQAIVSLEMFKAGCVYKNRVKSNWKIFKIPSTLI